MRITSISIHRVNLSLPVNVGSTGAGRAPDSHCCSLQISSFSLNLPPARGKNKDKNEKKNEKKEKKIAQILWGGRRGERSPSAELYLVQSNRAGRWDFMAGDDDRVETESQK